MADLRDRMTEDKGLLKKIQLAVPGYRGYRQREDLRDSDAMLRIQMADALVKVKGHVELAREMAAENYMLGSIDKIGKLINQLTALEGKVRHAEHGYSGFAADIEIGTVELNHLYEYDHKMLEGVSSLDREAAALPGFMEDEAKLKVHLRTISTQAQEFTENFERRIKVITGTEVI